MVRNEDKYQQALEFRKRGFTYAEIANIVGVSKSTVSTWLAKQRFSKKVKADNITKAARDNKKRLTTINKARKSERQLQASEIKRSAAVEFKHYKHSPLFVVGLGVYMASGDMTDQRQIRLATSRIEAQQVFLCFVREFLGVENKKIRFWLLLSPAHKESQCMKKWSKALSLPVSRFHRNQFIGTGLKAPLHNGVGNTIIGSTVLKQKLILWIELMLENAQNQ